MTIQVRESLSAALLRVAERFPDWRYGQLVANVAGWADVDPWEATDEELLAAAEAYLQADERTKLTAKSVSSD